MERFRFLGANRNFSASIGSFQGLPAEVSEVILLSQRLALKYNTTPRCSCQHFLTSFFQFLCGGSELPQSKPDGFASSLWEGASGAARRLLITFNTITTGLTACALSVKPCRAWLPLRGKTSPAPGEDVTVGDKRGILARERLRGFASPKG